MNKYIRAGMLVILLGIPAFIIAFLNLFGSNTFEVPEIDPFSNYTEIGIENPLNLGCNLAGSEELAVPTSLSSAFSKSGFKILFFTPDSCESECLSILQELVRAHDKVGTNGLARTFILSSEEGNTNWKSLQNEYVLPKGWHYISYQPTEEWKAFLTCGVYLSQPASDSFQLKHHLVCAFSPDNRLVGIYNFQKREEVDRLAFELEILNKKNQ